MMKWFRFYSEALNDPKVQRLPPVTFKHWVNILCLASEQSTRGVLPSVEDIAFSLRIETDDAEQIIGDLISRGLVDRDENGILTPHSWSSRQHESDDVTRRVRKFRNGEKGNVTRNVSRNVTETPPDTDTDTEQIQSTNGDSTATPSESASEESPKPSKPKERIEEIYQAYPRKEAKGAALKAIEAALKSIGKGNLKPDGWNGSPWPPQDAAQFLLVRVQEYSVATANTEKRFIPHPATWFSQGRYLNAPSAAEPQAAAMSYDEMRQRAEQF